MNTSCYEYELQVKKAKDTMGVLEGQLHNIRLNLKANPNNAAYLRDLKKVTLDMTITLNELEHSQNELDNCRHRVA